LFIAPVQASLQAVGQCVLAHGAGKDFLNSFFKSAAAFPGTSLVYTEDTLVFAGEGVAEGVFKKAALSVR
jgi:hypothetical protein